MKIKLYRGCAVVGRFIHVVPVLCFGARVAGMGFHMTVLSHLGGGLLRRSVRLQQVSQWARLRAPLMGVRGRAGIFFRRIRIPYKCPAFTGRGSLDTTAVTRSLHFAASGCCLADFIAEGLVLCASRDSAESLLTSVCGALRIFLWHCSDTEMATGRQVWC